MPFGPCRWVNLFIVLLVCHAARGVRSLDTSLVHSTAILPDQSLSAPSHLVQLDAQTFCFVAHRDDKGKPSHVTICSFNLGESFNEVALDLPFCGDQGVVVNGSVWCPNRRIAVPSGRTSFHEESNVTQDGVGDTRGWVDLAYDAVTFTPHQGALRIHSVHAPDGSRFTFRVKRSLLPTREADVASSEADNLANTSMLFNGNVLFDAHRRAYFMAASVVSVHGGKKDVEERTPVLLRSESGLSWHAIQALPCPQAEQLTLLAGEYNSFLLVCKKGDKQVVRVSIRVGEQWSKPLSLSNNGTPISVVFPTGVAIKHNLVNSTLWYVHNALSRAKASKPNSTQNSTASTEKADSTSAKSSPPARITTELTWKAPDARAASGLETAATSADEPTLEVRASGVLPSKANAIAIRMNTHDNTSKVLIVYEGKRTGKTNFIPKLWRSTGGGLHAMVLSLNDTAEGIVHAEEQERRRDDALRRAEQKERLRRQKYDRLARERAAQQRRWEERHKLFQRDDEANIEQAIQNMNVDGELIIVRAANKNFAEFELNSFFGDIVNSLAAKSNTTLN